MTERIVVKVEALVYSTQKFRTETRFNAIAGVKDLAKGAPPQLSVCCTFLLEKQTKSCIFGMNQPIDYPMGTR